VVEVATTSGHAIPKVLWVCLAVAHWQSSPEERPKS